MSAKTQTQGEAAAPEKEGKVPEKEVKVSLKAPHLKEGETFYRGTRNGELKASPTNPLLELKKEAQTFELKGLPAHIDALLARFEADDRIVVSIRAS